MTQHITSRPEISETFEQRFGRLPWKDKQRAIDLITIELPSRIAEEDAFRNAVLNADEQNTKIEFNRVLKTTGIVVMMQDMSFTKQFCDNPEFQAWMSDSVYQLARNNIETE